MVMTERKLLRTVIIVEDEPDVAEVQAQILKHVASVQIIAEDFRQCFDPGTWIGVDVAILDLMLPGVEGEDICRFLKVQFPRIRRIICTAKPTYVLPELAEIAHVVIQKPFTDVQLIAAVTKESGDVA
jgi:two-component system, OmpR family, response regulator RegX3